MTGLRYFSMMSPDFVLTLQKGVPGCGEQPMNVLHQYASHTAIVMVGIDSFFFSINEEQSNDNGTLTAQRYVNEILDVYVRPYAAVGSDFILSDDNARPHITSVTNQGSKLKHL